MWYAETRTVTGRWSPCTFARRPEEKKGRLVRNDNAGPPIRNITKIDPRYEGQTLDSLRILYGSMTEDVE